MPGKSHRSNGTPPGTAVDEVLNIESQHILLSDAHAPVG